MSCEVDDVELRVLEELLEPGSEALRAGPPRPKNFQLRSRGSLPRSPPNRKKLAGHVLKRFEFEVMRDGHLVPRLFDLEPRNRRGELCANEQNTVRGGLVRPAPRHALAGDPDTPGHWRL